MSSKSSQIQAPGTGSSDREPTAHQSPSLTLHSIANQNETLPTVPDAIAASVILQTNNYS